MGLMKNINLISQSASMERELSLGSEDITGFQARYLMEVSKEEGVPQEVLSRRLMVNKSNVARQLSALEANGYIARKRSETDKRVLLVYTTEKGKALIPKIRLINTEWKQIVCEGLDEKDKEVLEHALAIMVANARRRLGCEE